MTDCMGQWQRAWPLQCGSLCCYSPDCGKIWCTNCFRSLTSSAPLPQRYVCLECPLPPADEHEEDKVTYPDSLFTLCQPCFLLLREPHFLHQHTIFCTVDSLGVHSVVRRTVGVAAEHAIQLQDIHSFPWDEAEYGNLLCLVCFDAFSAESPPAIPIGCQKKHSMSIPDSVEGFKERGSYYHPECYLSSLQHEIGGVYCGDTLPLLCSQCQFEKMMGSFEEEFRLAFSRMKSEFLCRANDCGVVEKEVFVKIWEELGQAVQLPVLHNVPNSLNLQMSQEILKTSLCELHRQPWVQKRVMQISQEQQL